MLKSTETGAHLEYPEADPIYNPKDGHRLPKSSMGAFLLFKRGASWFSADADSRSHYDLENAEILRLWENRLGGRIYKLYGCDWDEGSAWEFFVVFEFQDLEAWQCLQNQMDRDGFSEYFSWNILALGRRLA